MNYETPISQASWLRGVTHSTLDFHRMEAIERIHGAADRIEYLEQTIREIRALKPRRMGDHWTWEEGLSPDDVFDLCDVAIKPPSA